MQDDGLPEAGRFGSIELTESSREAAGTSTFLIPQEPKQRVG